ncbi:MAG: sigma-70 family RNA polymerase sigma factor [Phycisphaeraceae bacterium]|nr:sigma-70 family RNA polymerase sigma factor [Phycisphaeraceae bacterium]
MYFARHLARIKSLQLARALPGSDALDLEQDLLVEVFSGWSRFDANRGRAEAFVEHLVAQRCWKLRRCPKYRVSRGKEQRLALNESTFHARDAACQAEKREAVRIAIARMPTQYRDACQALCDTDTVSDAARRLAIPRSTLDSIIAKVRHALAPIATV